MSKIEVNTIEPQCGTTLTLGASGDTIALASGASQSGFGRTGTVDWQTGSIKTSDFTAVDGQGFFVDTNGGIVVATLPTGSAGSIVSFQDYRNTFDTNNFKISPAGSQKINTGAGSVLLSTEGEGITLVYIDSTVGWRSIQDNVFADVGSNFITATGGTESTSGDDKIHTFTGPGTFTVQSLAVSAPNNVVSYMVVGGGGGAGTGNNTNNLEGGAGGGAGGFRETKSPVTPYTASPLCGASTPGNVITVTATAFPITVGSGGAGGAQTGPFTTGFPGTVGSNSIFSTITSAGGGKGGAGGPSPEGDGGNGGSGGGAGANNCTAGSGNTPPTTPAQGSNGSTGATSAGGGGGGATAAGGPVSTNNGADGGAGATTSINATPTAYAGGGGGGGETTKGCGGAGGGGAGYTNGSNGPGSGVAGTVNTGGGGGGAFSNSNSNPTTGGTGGSGIVIIRYKIQ
jgi:hypothetical protein